MGSFLKKTSHMHKVVKKVKGQTRRSARLTERIKKKQKLKYNRKGTENKVRELLSAARNDLCG